MYIAEKNVILMQAVACLLRLRFIPFVLCGLVEGGGEGRLPCPNNSLFILIHVLKFPMFLMTNINIRQFQIDPLCANVGTTCSSTIQRGTNDWGRIVKHLLSLTHSCKFSIYSTYQDMFNVHELNKYTYNKLRRGIRLMLKIVFQQYYSKCEYCKCTEHLSKPCM